MRSSWLVASLLPSVVLSLAGATGCASLKHRGASPSDESPPLAFEDEPQIERGRPHKIIDGIGWVTGGLEKLALWDRRAVNHNVSPRTEQSLAEYVAVNGMDSTKVRINQYDPGGEWRRLVANKRVGAGWRYTVGAISVLGYTILPGRLVGADNYNPYTDTINVYSDIPAIAMEQGGHAKNVHRRSLPGTYATFFSLPILTLFPERIAKADVLAYETTHRPIEEQIEANDTLYAQYGSEIGLQGRFLGGAGGLLMLPGGWIGRGVSKWHSGDLQERQMADALNDDFVLPASFGMPMDAPKSGSPQQASLVDPSVLVR